MKSVTRFDAVEEAIASRLTSIARENLGAAYVKDVRVRAEDAVDEAVVVVDVLLDAASPPLDARAALRTRSLLSEALDAMNDSRPAHLFYRHEPPTPPVERSETLDDLAASLGV